MTAKEYLQQVKQKKAIIKNLRRDKESITEMLFSLGGAGEGERVQSSRNMDKFGTLYGRIDEMERKIDAELASLVEFELVVSSQINNLKNEKNIEVLHRRYLGLQSWEIIADDMGYSVRYILRLHGLALEEFRLRYSDKLGLENG